MKTNSALEQELCPDAQLVEFSLLGDREAFGRIVHRYQSLVCSLAYAACGDLSRSEDLAQETFVAAWRNLANLQEPSRVKQWLCGIVRNRIREHCRHQTRDPVVGSSQFGEIESPDPGCPVPSEAAIGKEEEAILWRALEGLPRAYRDPLILYYRQDQSIAEVAEAIEISEDAVKQRLSRGRAMLTERMARFVESALHRTGPTRALTLAVLAALPAYTATASVVTLGTTVAKGTAAAKAAAWTGLLGAIIGPVLGILGGWFGVKASLANATSIRERKMIIRSTSMVVGLALVALGANVTLVFLGEALLKSRPVLICSLVIGFWVLFGGALLGLVLHFNRLQRKLRQEAGANPKDTAPRTSSIEIPPPFEYRSKTTLLGLPLIHIRAGRRPEERLRPALGWIAIGDFSVGVILSFGGVALGGISIGGLSAGVVTFGGIVAGVLAGGGLAIGLWAIGGAALGYMAAGGFAMAWHAAQGGLAVAHDLAQGGGAHALHANDDLARAFFAGHPFFKYAGDAIRGASWFALLCWLPMCLVFWHTMRMRRAMKSVVRQNSPHGLE